MPPRAAAAVTSDNATPPSSEHPAIWLMRRIGRFLKWTALIVFGLVIIVIGGIWTDNYWNETLPKSQVQVQMQSTWQDKCDDPFPLFVAIVNNSRRTVERVTFWPVAKRPGHSTDLVEYSARDYSTDKILKPGEGYAQCWAVPPLSDKSADWRTLEWSVGPVSVQFE
jgi:hypothetical protein